MIRIVVMLLAHDLAVAFKNKTLYLILGIPLFVYAALSLVDPTDAPDAAMNLACLETESYAPELLASMEQAPGSFAIRWAPDADEAMELLTQHEVDGLLEPDANDATRLRLTVLQQASPQTLIIMQRLSALQLDSASNGPAWLASIRALQTTSIKQQTLPTWILMIVLLVSFIVLPVQVAEEKEKQLLLGWMQTPVRESHWLAAKLLFGIVLMLASVVALHLLSGAASCTYGVLYPVMLCAGGFCFGALGICIGLLCRTQASARTLGLICYLPMLLPAALSDMSQELRSIAPLIPSYSFYGPVRGLLLDGSRDGPFLQPWIILQLIGLVACLVSHRLIRRRWLM